MGKPPPSGLLGLLYYFIPITGVTFKIVFSDASLQLYKRPYPSVCPSVSPSVGPSVGKAFVKIDEKWPFMDFK